MATRPRGAVRPPLSVEIHCARCGCVSRKDRMVRETDRGSEYYGLLVHRHCYDGPDPTKTIILDGDDTSPEEQL